MRHVLNCACHYDTVSVYCECDREITYRQYLQYQPLTFAPVLAWHPSASFMQRRRSLVVSLTLIVFCLGMLVSQRSHMWQHEENKQTCAFVPLASPCSQSVSSLPLVESDCSSSISVLSCALLSSALLARSFLTFALLISGEYLLSSCVESSTLTPLCTLDSEPSISASSSESRTLVDMR